MTIPQHIEPFILRDNPALHTALKNCQMPHGIDQGMLLHLSLISIMYYFNLQKIIVSDLYFFFLFYISYSAYARIDFG